MQVERGTDQVRIVPARVDNEIGRSKKKKKNESAEGDGKE